MDTPQLVPGVQLGGGRWNGDQAAVCYQDVWGETLPFFLKGEEDPEGRKERGYKRENVTKEDDLDKVGDQRMFPVGVQNVTDFATGRYFGSAEETFVHEATGISS